MDAMKFFVNLIHYKYSYISVNKTKMLFIMVFIC